MNKENDALNEHVINKAHTEPVRLLNAQPYNDTYKAERKHYREFGGDKWSC